ncbi:hypothetical protein ACH4SP_23005 [Streptomyces sp. NPDC021093]|uniref:hypothetical protein n=1 Tax=Streptomyces sp. NPDC021093 TaxID=3365112 RepID=UPI00379477F7
MAGTLLAMMLWGLPADDPKPVSQGTVSGRGDVRHVTDTPPAVNPAGTYTEMASRLAEPVLLGFAVLAVRGRVKR